MKASDRFEVMAEKFYRETGMMAPGKDFPAELSGPDCGERVDAWKIWIENFYSELFDKNFALPK